MNRARITPLVVALVCLAWVGSFAQGAYMDVRVDLNQYYNTGYSPSAGTTYSLPANWNVIQTPSSTPQVLNDFVTGLGSGTTLKTTGSFIDSTNPVTAFSWSNAAAPWVEESILYDYFAIGSGGSGTVTLEGLDPGSVYRLELMSARDYAASNSSYLVNGTAGSIVDGGGSSAAWNSRSNGLTNMDFMLWDAISPNSSGQFVIDVAAGSGQIVFFNGLRLSATPEPSSLILILAGGLAMLGGLGVRTLRRRRLGR